MNKDCAAESKKSQGSIRSFQFKFEQFRVHLEVKGERVQQKKSWSRSQQFYFLAGIVMRVRRNDSRIRELAIENWRNQVLCSFCFLRNRQNATCLQANRISTAIIFRRVSLKALIHQAFIHFYTDEDSLKRFQKQEKREAVFTVVSLVGRWWEVGRYANSNCRTVRSRLSLPRLFLVAKCSFENPHGGQLVKREICLTYLPNKQINKMKTYIKL